MPTAFARHSIPTNAEKSGLALYIDIDIMKPVVFLGDSLARIRGFPERPRGQIGFELRRVQHGEEPADWKPMRSIGPGVREIRVRDASGAFRVLYVATLADAIYVLHALQKKTQVTARKDLELATIRFRLLR